MENFDFEKFCERFNSLIGGKSQLELSKEMNLSQPVISKLKKGIGQSPSADTIVTIANYFNVSTDWLLGLTDELNQDKAKLSAKARVELELKDLKCKIKKLDSFINKFVVNCNDFDKQLNFAERYLLLEQETKMYEYMRILEARLSIWRDLDGDRQQCNKT